MISRRSLLRGAILGAGAIAAGLGRPRPARAAGVTPADGQQGVAAARWKIVRHLRRLQGAPAAPAAAPGQGGTP